MGLAWYNEIEGEWTPPELAPDPETGAVPRKISWLPVVLERQEVQALLSASDLTRREALLLRTLYASALRVDELVALRAESLDRETGSLQVGEERRAILDPETFAALAELDWSGWRWTPEQVEAVLLGAGGQVGVAQRYRAMGRRLLPKALRYSCATHCLENGMDLYALHKLMGHAYVDTTESVQKLAVGRWRKLYDACHPLGCHRTLGGSEQSHLSELEVLNLLEAGRAVGNPVDAGRNVMMLRLLYAAGLRVSELANLLYADVFYSEARLFVRQGKGSKDRYVLLDWETARLLREFQGEQPLSAPVMDIKVRQIANVVKRVGEHTGLLEKYESQGYSLSPHSFRHAYATHLYRNHMDSFALEKLMGHVDLETTFADYVSCDLPFWQAAYARHHELSQQDDIVVQGSRPLPS